MHFGLPSDPSQIAAAETKPVCLFVYADGKEEQIKAATLAMQVSRSWDLAARPRTIYCSSTLLLRG